MKARTNVISDREIYSIPCPNCFARKKALCFDNRGIIRQLAHPERILKAQFNAMRRVFGTVLDQTSKSLIVYYAFIMLCDSVSTQALALFGKEFTSEEIQAFYAGKAIEELKKDGLIPNAPTDSRIVS